MKTVLHSKESMIIIQGGKKDGMSWKREALKLRKRTSECKEMKGSENQAHLFVACFCLTFLDLLTVHKVQSHSNHHDQND